MSPILCPPTSLAARRSFSPCGHLPWAERAERAEWREWREWPAAGPRAPRGLAEGAAGGLPMVERLGARASRPAVVASQPAALVRRVTVALPPAAAEWRPELGGSRAVAVAHRQAAALRPAAESQRVRAERPAEPRVRRAAAV